MSVTLVYNYCPKMQLLIRLCPPRTIFGVVNDIKEEDRLSFIGPCMNLNPPLRSESERIEELFLSGENEEPLCMPPPL